MSLRSTLSDQILHRGDLSLSLPYRFPVKKARNNRLTDYDGNIYLDFYLQAGSVFLGYKSKPLSTSIHNRLSMGYLGGFYSHLYSRVLQTLKLHFQSRITSPFFLYLFTNSESRENFIKQYEIREPRQVCSIFSLGALDPQNPIFCDRSFSNGAPIDILILSRQIPFTASLDFSPLVLESLLQTLKQFQKPFLLDIQSLSSFFKNYGASYHSTSNICTLPIDIEKWKKLSQRLYEKKIITDPWEPKIYFSTSTTLSDFRRLFSLIKAFL